MKSFKIYLTEANYMRFLKKNPNLSDEERYEINKFFSKVNPQAGSDFEKKIGWQTKKAREMSYQDFENLMMNTKVGRKKNLQKIKIPGVKGKDYWPIKLSNKNFIANIPLNYKTAKFMNSCKYGTINVNYCIGWEYGNEYWEEHVIDEGKIPIYITDGIKKWVVMILPDNKKYEVWDKFNKENIADYNKEPIPGFSIKKELLGPKKAKLYDEIREKHLNFSKYKDIIDDFESKNNTLVIEEDTKEEIVRWFDNTFFYLDVSYCYIYLSNRILKMSGGRVKLVFDLEDKLIPIVFINCELKDMSGKLEGFLASKIEKCYLDDCGFEYTSLKDCTFQKKSQTFEHCVIEDSIIHGGVYEDCFIENCQINDGYFEECKFKNVLMLDGDLDECELDDDTKISEKVNIIDNGSKMNKIARITGVTTNV